MAKNFNTNTFHNDRWSMSFSNLPGLETRELPMYDRFVKSIVVPDYNMEEIMSDGYGMRIRHPGAPRPNQDLSQLQIEFKASEDLQNYFKIFRWMQSMKYGKPSELDEKFDSEKDLFRKYTIKGINLELLDNQKRLIATLKFTQCFLTTLSSLSLEQGNSDEITFTCNFSYEEIVYDLVDINT